MMNKKSEPANAVVRGAIVVAAVCLVATIMIPSRAMTVADEQMAQARTDMVDIVTFQNRAYGERKEFIGTLDSLQLFVDWQTTRYNGVVDTLEVFFGATAHATEDVAGAAEMAGDLREYFQYVVDPEDPSTGDKFVAFADSIFQFLRYQQDVQEKAEDFRRIFGEVEAELSADMIGQAAFLKLAGKVDSLELAFRAYPEQMALHGLYREALYLTRALLPGQERFKSDFFELEAYLAGGAPRDVESLRNAAAVADSLRFGFLFGGDSGAGEGLEWTANFLDYRADIVDRRDGYISLFGSVSDYLRDAARDPELARGLSDDADSLKYCFLYDEEAVGQEGAVDRLGDLSRISNFLYGLSSAWNAQLDSLTEVVPESMRNKHRRARDELKVQFAEDQAAKLEKAKAFADDLGVMLGEFTATLESVDEDLSAQSASIGAFREAFEARLGQRLDASVSLADLAALLEVNAVGQEARFASLARGLAGLDRSQFPPSEVRQYSPAPPQARYRLEIEGDKVSVRCFHRDDFGEIKEGDPTW